MAHHLPSGEKFPLEAGSKFQLAKKAASVVAYTNGVKDVRAEGIYRFADKKWEPIHQQEGKYEQLSIAENGAQIAFLANFDTTESRIEPFDVYHWSSTAGVNKVVDRTADFLEEDWLISKNGRLEFSQNGKRLFFGIAPAPALKDTSLLPVEEVSVEVWSYRDPVLYTQQEVQASREKRRTYRCVLFTDNGKVMQLGSKQLPEVRIGAEGNSAHIIAYNDRPYLKNVSWEGGPSAKDVYLINLASGDQKQIATGLRGNPAFSPEGKFVYWYPQTSDI